MKEKQMSIDTVLELFKERNYLITMGAATVSKRYGIPEDLVRKARAIFRREKKMINIKRGGPKILIFDIETAPLRAYVWKRFKENISLDQTISEWFMLCFSAKWLHSETVISHRLSGAEVIEEDDSRIVKQLWDLLNEADIVVAHNAKKFDIPKANSRFICNGLFPPSAYKIVDTLDVAKKQFGFSSNKLDALATMFGLPSKYSTTFNLWAECMKGDEKSLEYMSTYCAQDTNILEEVYLRLLPYIKSHPNYNLYIEEEEAVCPSCGGNHIEFSGYYYFTPTSKYENYRCKDCGALSRNRKSVQKNKNILINN